MTKGSSRDARAFEKSKTSRSTQYRKSNQVGNVKSGSPPHLLLEVAGSKWVGEPD